LIPHVSVATIRAVSQVRRRRAFDSGIGKDYPASPASRKTLAGSCVSVVAPYMLFHGQYGLSKRKKQFLDDGRIKISESIDAKVCKLFQATEICDVPNSTENDIQREFIDCRGFVFLILFCFSGMYTKLTLRLRYQYKNMCQSTRFGPRISPLKQWSNPKNTQIFGRELEFPMIVYLHTSNQLQLLIALLY
jgi:hypothetical protein